MKIPIDIETYMSNFLGGNARQYLFYAQINFPGLQNTLTSGIKSAIAGLPENLITGMTSAATVALGANNMNSDTNKFGFNVKSTNLPSSTIDQVSTFFCGQEYKMSSLQKFEDWQVTFNIDNKGIILKKFHDWQKMLHDAETNVYGTPEAYMTNQEIHLLGMETGETICVYTLYGAWPSSIGSVSLDYSSNDFATVDITFTYQYYTVKEMTEGALTGFLKQYGRSLLGNTLNGMFNQTQSTQNTLTNYGSNYVKKLWENNFPEIKF